MKSGKGHHVEEEEEDEYGFGSHKNTKDGKNSDKANAIRSKHSVTEQRRRSKINERFQLLRNLIPHTDQKRDTASFLLEVIQYVESLQEKVQKYEGSYEPWSSEPTKLMPWRNSHWRTQSVPAPPQALKNDAGTGPAYSGRFDENLANATSSMQAIQQNSIESLPGTDVPFKSIDQQKELASSGIATQMPVPLQNDSAFSHSLHRPGSDEFANTANTLNHEEEFMIKGGTISISSSYSQGLLDSLTQTLETAGLDLSQATISVQINLGKQANRGMTSGPSIAKDNETTPPVGNQFMEQFQDTNHDEDLDHAEKRLKI